MVTGNYKLTAEPWLYRAQDWISAEEGVMLLWLFFCRLVAGRAATAQNRSRYSHAIGDGGRRLLLVGVGGPAGWGGGAHSHRNCMFSSQGELVRWQREGFPDSVLFQFGADGCFIPPGNEGSNLETSLEDDVHKASCPEYRGHLICLHLLPLASLGLS